MDFTREASKAFVKGVSIVKGLQLFLMQFLYLSLTQLDVDTFEFDELVKNALYKCLKEKTLRASTGLCVTTPA